MKPRPFLNLLLLLSVMLLASCDAIIEPSISKQTIVPEAPTNQYVSTSYTVNFWWDQVDHSLSYHLQVVTPTFAAPGSLVLDTVISSNKFAFNFNPGTYQWRVLAQNGSSQTIYSTARSFTVVSSSIKQQAVQLISPVNSILTNKSAVIFQWGSLYGATQYRLEIDTNNFQTETAIVANLVLPGQQANFTLPKDQTYQWRVRAENDTAQSQWSVINLITLDQTPPAQVIAASPADGATAVLPVSLQWDAVSTAIKYKVYIFDSDGVTLYSSGYPAPVTTTNYSFNAGTSGTKFYWQVSAVDAAGNEGTASVLRSYTVQ